MEELKGLVRDLDGDVKGLRKATNDREAGQRKRDKRRDKLIAALIVAVLVAAVFIWRFVAQSNCNTNRTRALTGPGAERVSHLIGAFRASVLADAAKLTPKERVADMAELREARKSFPGIPDDAALAKLPTSSLLIYVDAIRSIRTDDVYHAALKRHPVCTLWGI